VGFGAVVPNGTGDSSPELLASISPNGPGARRTTAGRTRRRFRNRIPCVGLV